MKQLRIRLAGPWRKLYHNHRDIIEVVTVPSSSAGWVAKALWACGKAATWNLTTKGSTGRWERWGGQGERWAWHGSLFRKGSMRKVEWTVGHLRRWPQSLITWLLYVFVWVPCTSNVRNFEISHQHLHIWQTLLSRVTYSKIEIAESDNPWSTRCQRLCSDAQLWNHPTDDGIWTSNFPNTGKVSWLTHNPQANIWLRSIITMVLTFGGKSWTDLTEQWTTGFWVPHGTTQYLPVLPGQIF